MASNPVNAYRGQQGMPPVVGGFHPDARVLDWIVQAAKETHADPIALLATALQESGARRGAVGDSGTSFGPFQFNIHGAGAGHTTAYDNSYAAVLNRAQEFARNNVHGGPGAAAVQRPLDRQLYAKGVNSLLPVARQILGQSHVPAGQTTPDGTPVVPKGLPDMTPIERLAGSDPMAQVKYLETILNPRASVDDLLGLVQQPQADSPPPGGSAVSPPGGGATTLKPTGKVVPGQARIIGRPYQGTHNLGNWESDNAVDIALPLGTALRAPFSGVIGDRIGSLGAGGRFAGLRVHLLGAGQELYFAHLSRLTVTAGQRVKAGQIIGYSGEANGVAHLHLGAKTGDPGVYA